MKDSVGVKQIKRERRRIQPGGQHFAKVTTVVVREMCFGMQSSFGILGGVISEPPTDAQVAYIKGYSIFVYHKHILHIL